MKYLSVCSGIESATVAWHPLGWEAFAYSEIEKFPCQVLAHHYPDTPNLGDMTKFQEWPDAAIDVLVGGTPCQSFSIAGLREGLSDPRGNLMLTYLAIAAKYRPKWLVWENVPGVLSSNGGNDFASLLRGMAELGYGFAYRVLDAQYFGVAQRRRRVFVVGCLRDWRRAASVLFDTESLRGNPAPSRQTGQRVAEGIEPSVGSGKSTIGTLMANAGQKLWLGNQEALSGDYHILQPTYGIAGNIIGRKPENGGNGEGWSEEISYTLTKTDQHAVVALPINTQIAMRHEALGKGTGMGIGADGDPAFTLQSAHSHAVAFSAKDYGADVSEDVSPTLRAGGHDKSHANSGNWMAIQRSMQVRRLTPVECERLQGFKDNYTLIKENTPDGPRYKALGNSMAVPVMEWIGQRIQAVESVQKERVAA